MTYVVSSQSPENGSTSPGQRPFIQFTVTGDDPVSPPTRSSLNVTVGGEPAIANGQPVGGFQVSITEEEPLIRMMVSIRPTRDMPERTWMGVHVTYVGVDVGWVFYVDDCVGPQLRAVTPALGQDGQPPFPRVQFDVDDAHPQHGVALRTVLKESSVGSSAGNTLSVADIDFTGTVGHLVEINGTPAFILAEIGPNIVVTTFALNASGLNVKLFRPTGLDVTIGNDKIVSFGQPLTGRGWTAVVTTPAPGRRRVVLQKITTPIANGARVELQVKAQDDQVDRVNASVLPWNFYVGDIKGPRIANVTPRPGSRGLSMATSTQPQLDIVDPDAGVALSSIFVTVGAVTAISAGVPAGAYSTSTVVVTGGGYRVTLKRTAVWPGPREEPISVRATDMVGNACREPSWIWHFGVTQSEVTQAVGAIVRTVPFDLTGSSFIRPRERSHTGYGIDGYWYNAGAKSQELQASWFTESSGPNRSSQQQFPASGHFMLGVNFWIITDAAGVLWMKSTALGSATTADWSMAGAPHMPLVDGSPTEDPVFFMAGNENVIQLSFVADKAWRTTTSGRQLSTGNMAARNSNQGGGAFGPAFTMSGSGGNAQRIGSSGRDGSWMFAVARGSQLEMQWSLSEAARADMELSRGYQQGVAGYDRNRSSALLLASSTAASWARVSSLWATPGWKNAPLVAAYETAAPDAKVVVVDWAATIGLLAGHRHEVPVASGEGVRDCDQILASDASWLLAAALPLSGVKLYELSQGDGSESTLSSPTLVNLGLSGVSGASPELKAVSIDKAMNRDRGNLFVALSTATAGRVTRWRHQPVSATPDTPPQLSTQRVMSLSSLGASEISEARFFRASMEILVSDIKFVYATMTVE